MRILLTEDLSGEVMNSLLRIYCKKITRRCGLVYLLGIVLVVGLWLLVWRQVSTEYDEAVNASSRETANLAIGFQEHILRIISGADKDLRKIIKISEREGLTGKTVDELIRISGDDPSIVQVAITNDKGIIVASYERRALGNDLSDRAYFQHQLSSTSDQLYIDKALTGKASGIVGIPMSRRITNLDGSFAGIAMIAVKIDHLLAFYNRMDLGENQLIGLYGLDGMVRARRHNDQNGYGESYLGGQLWSSFVKSKSGTIILQHRFDETWRITSYSVMPEYPLVTVVGKSVQVALAEFEQRKRVYVWGAFLTSLVISGICYALIRRHEEIERSNEKLLAQEEELLAQNEQLQTAKTTLGDEREWLSSLLAGISDEVWFTDVNKRMIYVNQTASSTNFSDLYRLDLEQLESTVQFVLPDGTIQAIDALPPLRALFGEHFHNERVTLRLLNSGRLHYRAISANPVRNTQGGIIGAVSVVRDISEQKRFEQDLVTSKERYEALLNQSSEAIIIFDFPSFNIVEVNNAAMRIFGYSEEEFLAINKKNFLIASADELACLHQSLEENRRVEPAVRSYRHKDGHKISVERTGSIIEFQGQFMALFHYLDVTREHLFQERIRADVEMAGKVQKAMLPGESSDEKIRIKTIYEPVHLISGDYYGYRWVRGNSQLNGYLMDVTGHGMATALQTAAAGALLHKEMEKESAWSEDSLKTLNNQFSSYLPADSYVSVLAFSFDFNSRVLTCVSAGINHFVAFSQGHHGWVSLRGSFLGNMDVACYETMCFPLQHGDTFYFMTDGLYDSLVPDKKISCETSELFGEFHQRAVRNDKTDDCTVLYFNVKAFSHSPAIFTYADQTTRGIVLSQIRQLLTDITDNYSFWVELALGEAETNAYKYGNEVRIKLNIIGNRLVIRVFNSGPGFAGNEILSQIKKMGIEKVFENSMENEHGRGILIMMVLMDKVLYNKFGTEVILVKTLPSCKKRM